jgi:hypothetical protein
LLTVANHPELEAPPNGNELPRLTLVLVDAIDTPPPQTTVPAGQVASPFVRVPLGADTVALRTTV